MSRNRTSNIPVALDAEGAPLPAAASYEVWLETDGQPDVLAASVADTTCVLRLETGATYRVRVRGVSAGGIRSSFSEFSDPYRAPRPSPATLLAPAGFESVGPNPFNGTAVIACRLPPGAGTVTLDVCDARGRRVRRWILEPGTGRQAVSWDGRDDEGRHVPAGAYLLRLGCGATSWTRKLTMLP